MKEVKPRIEEKGVKVGFRRQQRVEVERIQISSSKKTGLDKTQQTKTRPRIEEKRVEEGFRRHQLVVIERGQISVGDNKNIDLEKRN